MSVYDESKSNLVEAIVAYLKIFWLNLSGTTGDKTRNTSGNIVGDPAEIRTEYLQNASQTVTVGSDVVIRSMMEAASTSETSVHFYQTTRHNNPEDNHLHTRCRENLKSHLKSIYYKRDLSSFASFWDKCVSQMSHVRLIISWGCGWNLR
jgi:hypothetical protein